MSFASSRTNCARGKRFGFGEISLAPRRHTRHDVLLVSFAATAECACHLALGWSLPANELDLSPVFRNLVNGRSTPDGKGLLGALRYYGLDAIATKQKDAMRDRILQGWPFTPAEQQSILDYCASDVEALGRLLSRILARAGIQSRGRALSWRICRRVRGHGAQRRPDRYGNIPATHRQEDLGPHPRCDGADR